MKYVKFGSTGLEVSPLALGTVFREQRDEDKALNVIEAAIDRGINFLDCANMYGPYEERIHGPGGSERILAKAIKGKRDRVVITSKVEEPVGTGPNDKGLSRYHIMREVEHSLTRLGTDHIDIYIAHHPDRTTPIEETVWAMNHILDRGKALYWGTSEWSAEQILEAYHFARSQHLIPPLMEQPQYNMFVRERVEQEYAPLYKDFGLGTTIWSPLASGLLTGKYNDGVPDEFVGQPNLLRAPLACPPVESHSPVDHVAHRPNGLLDRRVDVGSVAEDQVDIIQLKSGERGDRALDDVLSG